VGRIATARSIRRGALHWLGRRVPPRRGWRASSSRQARYRIFAWRFLIGTSLSMSLDVHFRPAVTRRDVLVSAAHGFGSLALASLLPLPVDAHRANPLAAKAPHFPANAKSVIFLLMLGGTSQVDT